MFRYTRFNASGASMSSFVLLMPYGGYFGDYADDTVAHARMVILLLQSG